MRLSHAGRQQREPLQRRRRSGPRVGRDVQDRTSCQQLVLIGIQTRHLVELNALSLVTHNTHHTHHSHHRESSCLLKPSPFTHRRRDRQSNRSADDTDPVRLVLVGRSWLDRRLAGAADGPQAARQQLRRPMGADAADPGSLQYRRSSSSNRMDRGALRSNQAFAHIQGNRRLTPSAAPAAAATMPQRRSSAPA